MFSCREKATDRASAGRQSALAALDLKQGAVITCGPPDQEFGKVAFATSCPGAAADFNLALSLLHSFEYKKAEKVFARIIAANPDCAMAYWGVAMRRCHPLWTPPSAAELRKAQISTMSEHLLDHMSKFVALREEDRRGILAFFGPQHLKKKDNLLEEGKICKYHYFIVKGCLRMFFVNEKGVEQTTYFAIENWWLTDYLAFQSQQITGFYIQAVEDTQVLAIDWQAQERLLEQYPYLERYFRLVYHRAYGAAQLRIKYLYGFSREELYYHFSTHFPDFVQRIPQYLLASFLGFTPEYLSEIRKKKRS